MELTNRQAFFEVKNKFQSKNIAISNSEIYAVLLKANKFENHTELIKNFDENCANLDYFYEKMSEIEAGKPIQYVLNEAPFLEFVLYVDERVLIPRPETEGLVTLTCGMIEKYEMNNGVIGDICTGSGCIALAMRHFYPYSAVYGSDISKEALEVAKLNAKKLKIGLLFLEGDKCEPFIKEDIKLDVLISNPPYVSNIDDIEPKVKNFEPMNAIYNKSGVEFYENYFKNYKKLMNEKFLMAFEINYDQQEKLIELIKKYFEDEVHFEFHKDIYGLTRYLFIYKGY